MAIETIPMQALSGDAAIIYSARQWRASLFGNVFSREGVIDLRGGHLKISQRGAGANFTIDMAIGRAAVFGDDASDQGAYAINSTTVVNKTVPAASTTTTRTHRVILQVRDKLENGTWSVYSTDVIVQADTTAAATLPQSAIPLATIAVPANATSVTNAMITDIRGRASVGTPAVDGAMGALYVGFVASDSTRPLRWSVNPDGWVQLSGWVRWNEGSTTIAAGEQRTFGGTPLADPAVKPPGIRDFPGTSFFGPVHVAVGPNGAMSFRFQQSVTLTTATWFSFDGCFYRI